MSNIKKNAFIVYDTDIVHNGNMSSPNDITATEYSEKNNVFFLQSLLEILTLQDEKIRMLQEQVTKNIRINLTSNDKLDIENLRYRFMEQVKNYAGEKINDPKLKFKE